MEVLGNNFEIGNKSIGIKGTISYRIREQIVLGNKRTSIVKEQGNTLLKGKEQTLFRNKGTSNAQEKGRKLLKDKGTSIVRE